MGGIYISARQVSHFVILDEQLGEKSGGRVTGRGGVQGERGTSGYLDSN